ncbi:MAG: polysaccharide deacetylase family protein [Candidatus Eisenbacteria bacterium]|nr:polysaccharide deacetylase family protein [Candidatus Eisenbacteria bacterium]
MAEKEQQRPAVASRRVTRPRIRNRWLLAAALVVVMAAILATVAMLRTYPPPVEGRRPSAVTGRTLRGVDAVILGDPWNERYFASMGANHQLHVARWVAALEPLGLDIHVIPEIAHWQGELLVLPQSYCLSDGDLRRINDQLQQGAGVLFAGVIGVRDSGGSWIGWERMQKLLGGGSLHEYAPSEAGFITCHPRGPVSLLGAGGRRIGLGRRENQYGWSGLPAAAYWSDYLRRPLPSADTLYAAAAIGHRGVGRFAWIGYDPDLPGPDPADAGAGRELMLGLLRWCLGYPSAEADLWPAGRQAAFLIAEDTEEGFRNALATGEILSSRGIRGSFLCLSGLAQRHRDVVRDLARRHEIGSHGDVHTRFSGQSAGVQARRLKRSAEVLSSLAGRPVRGFRPPEEAWDEKTIEALLQTGYSYLLAGNAESPQALPVFLAHGEDKPKRSLIRIPRLIRDDYDLFVTHELDAAGAAAVYRDAVETIRGIRGVAYISIHTQLTAAGQALEAIRRLLDTLPRDNLWITTPGRLAQWWRTRSQIAVELAEDRRPGFILRVGNRSAEALEEAGIWIALPGNPGDIVLSPPAATLSGPDERGAYRIALPRLAPGSEIAIRISASSLQAASLRD